MKIQPKVHCFIFIITNEDRDEIYDFCSDYIVAVEKFKQGFHDLCPGRCITKVQMVEDQIFGSCVPVIARAKEDGDDIPF
ncbi:hypothetical protein PP940_gp123 [Rhizobium phage RL2RES]|uniref:Uncharacterized protein n=1 Tax=Rhizobium phage RL2RES TaxID=103371 RepID=A0A6B9J6A4_9CAUD|nr:hypothetical protein PP940_gp123 [Rhizobium phage RL2RES]QGZ14305.1 hypothetical protein RL2RES_123 [Rhizobium phage RL2RES]